MGSRCFNAGSQGRTASLRPNSAHLHESRPSGRSDARSNGAERARYGHLSQTLVMRGATAGRGEVIGRAGRTPTGQPAVYFELRIDGRPVDLVQWLRSLR
jgi:Peptidase family M23